MKRTLCGCIIAAMFFVFGGCKNAEHEKRYPSLQESVAEKVYERSAGNCDHPDSVCARVTLRYLEFGQGLPPAVRDSLTVAMRTSMFASTEEGEEGGTPEAVTAGFLKTFEAMHKEMPDAAARWSLERSAAVVGDTLGIATIAIEEGSYTGGAHPNAFRSFRVFDLVSGRTLALADIVVPGKMDSLNAIAEEEFRSLVQLGPAESLDSAGFSFPDDRFKVNTNFGVFTSDLTFQFNPYEVAPYAVGPIEVCIPFERLRTIVELRPAR